MGQCPLETRPFDLTLYLDTDEARAASMTDALESGDPTFIVEALGVVARSCGLSRVALDAGLSPEGLNHVLSADGMPELGNWLRVIHALGLRLTVEPADH